MRRLAVLVPVLPLAVGCKVGHQINCVRDQLVVPPVTATDPRTLVLSPSLTTKTGPVSGARLVMFLQSKSDPSVAVLGAFTGTDGHGVARLNRAETLNDEQMARLRTATKYEVRFQPTKQESHGKQLCDADGANTVTFTESG